MNTVEIHRQSMVTRSPTMCRMNACKPSVSKGHSCNTLVQRLPRPCIWYLSVATLAPRSRSTICTKVPPKMSYMEPQMWTQTKGISTKLVFFSNLGICTHIFLMNNKTPNEPIQR